MTELETVMAIEPVVGYRLFQLKPEAVLEPWAWRDEKYQIGVKYTAYCRMDPTLYENNPYVFLPREFHEFVIADFNMKHETFPAIDCQCGFWALRSRDAVVEFFFNRNFPLAAIGPVLLSGKVIEHENGYRASEMIVLQPELVLSQKGIEEMVYPHFYGGCIFSRKPPVIRSVQSWQEYREWGNEI